MRLLTRRNCSEKGKRRRSMTAVSQSLSMVLPLRAELWSGSPTKTRLPKPADVGVKDCSPEMWCVPDGRWHKGRRPTFRRSAALADLVASPKQNGCMETTHCVAGHLGRELWNPCANDVFEIYRNNPRRLGQNEPAETIRI